jgi:tetrahydromethanopterin S-methyltransferase subunit G
MKDKDNVLRELDEIDNMVFILGDLAQKRSVDTNEAVRRLKVIRQKIKFVTERVSLS